MSVQYDPARAKFVVRWREDGKQRGRRFSSESEARAFDARVNPTALGEQRGANGRACDRVDAATILAPTQAFGASDHHLPFGATLSLTALTSRSVVRDLLRSVARAGCTRVLVLNGHGGNAAICADVASEAAEAEGIVVATCSYWELLPAPPGVPGRYPGHAGVVETSLMLAVAPELVEARPRTPLAGGSDGQSVRTARRRPGDVATAGRLHRRPAGRLGRARRGAGRAVRRGRRSRDRPPWPELSAGACCSSTPARGADPSNACSCPLRRLA